MSETTVVRDVTEATFQAEVVEASRERPVVVDFWAPWCGPCRQLSPMLEQVAAQHAGEIDVVKLNVDDAQATAARHGVRGIPAVKAFRDGAVVAEFTGLQPRPAVERFFAGLLPSESDRLVEQAEHARGEERRPLLEEALRQAPGHARARQLLAELELNDEQVDDAELARLRAAAEDGDGSAKIRLGRALAAAGRHDEALAVLVAAVAQPQLREPARQAALEIFAALGDEHPAVRTWRPKLSTALF